MLQVPEGDGDIEGFQGVGGGQLQVGRTVNQVHRSEGLAVFSWQKGGV